MIPIRPLHHRDKAVRRAKAFLRNRICECGEFSLDHDVTAFRRGTLLVSGLPLASTVPCRRFRPVAFRITRARKKK